MDLESTRVYAFFWKCERKNFARNSTFACSIVLMSNHNSRTYTPRRHAKSPILKAVLARVLAGRGLAVPCCPRIERYAYRHRARAQKSIPNYTLRQLSRFHRTSRLVSSRWLLHKCCARQGYIFLRHYLSHDCGDFHMQTVFFC